MLGFKGTRASFRKMRHAGDECFVAVVLTLAVLIIGAGGCQQGKEDESFSGDSERETEMPEVDPWFGEKLVSSPPLAKLPKSTVQQLSVTLDGDASEWPDSAVIWHHRDEEAEVKCLDITSTSIAADNKFLYLFLTTSPTVAEDWKANYEACISPESSDKRSDLFQLYIDSDMKPNTGNKPFTNPKFQVGGYDEKIEVSFPHYVYEGVPKEIPILECTILEAGDDSFSQRELPDEKWVLNSLEHINPERSEKKANTSPYGIAVGKDGIEVAIPYELLTVGPGDTFRILLAEFRDKWMKQRSMKSYREMVVTVPTLGGDDDNVKREVAPIEKDAPQSE